MKANEAEKAMEKYLATCGFLDFAGFEVSHPERRANAAAWWVLQGVRAGIIEQDGAIPQGTIVEIPAGTAIRTQPLPGDEPVFVSGQAAPLWVAGKPRTDDAKARHPSAYNGNGGNGHDVA